MKLRKRSVVLIIVISILVISAGSFFWIMSSPRFFLKTTNIKLYPIQIQEFKKILPTEEELKQIQDSVAKMKQNKGEGAYDFYKRQMEYWDFLYNDVYSKWGYVMVTTGKGISGTLINNSIRQFSDINIKFAIYNDSENQIGTFNIHIDNLQPHRTFVFKETLDQELFENGASSCEVISITAK